jgi:predicted DNA-binding transcriptional regulator AlpA
MSGVWLSREAVLAALGVHRQTLWRLQRDANFPQPIQRGFFQERDVLNSMRRHRWRKQRRRLSKPPSSRRRDRTDAPADLTPPTKLAALPRVDWVSYGVARLAKGGLKTPVTS